MGDDGARQAALQATDGIALGGDVKVHARWGDCSGCDVWVRCGEGEVGGDGARVLGGMCVVCLRGGCACVAAVPCLCLPRFAC